MPNQIKSILTDFLAQAESNNLKTRQYPRTYSDLVLKVSFGQGVSAKIPWISFLGRNQTTSNGIYPVYLFFKKHNILILAYGVSEENTPSLSWNIDAQTITVKEYLNKLGKDAERYGTSYIYTVYDLTANIDWTIIETDLEILIRKYQKLISNMPLQYNPTTIPEVFELQNVLQAFRNAGYQIQSNIVVRFSAAILTKPFVILTGLSGSGKTKLAMAFSKWICENENQICIVPVGADWTNREPLLGFPNALETGKYILPENGGLNLLIEASKEENRNKPYFLILDEMNLSHVERYFADFLSAMESGEAISLHADSDDWKDEIPANLKLPANLFIVGTVNIDETTYMFSPKVLDRASVIEFRVSEEEMKEYLQSKSKLNLDELTGSGASMAGSFIDIARNNNLESVKSDILKEAMMAFFTELKKTGAEFGYRSAAEILRFAAVVNKIQSDWDEVKIMDAAIMQKLLPKVHGSRRKLEPVLRTLAALCLQDGQNVEDYLTGKTKIRPDNVATIKYPVSLEKIVRMYDNLISNGFTSYAEA